MPGVLLTEECAWSRAHWLSRAVPMSPRAVSAVAGRRRLARRSSSPTVTAALTAVDDLGSRRRARRPDAPAARRLVRARRARRAAPTARSSSSGSPTRPRPSRAIALGADAWVDDDVHVVAAAGRLVAVDRRLIGNDPPRERVVRSASETSTGGSHAPRLPRSSFPRPTTSGARSSRPSSSRSPARPAPSGRSPASTGTATTTACTSACAAASRCSRRRRSSSRAPAGRASSRRSTPRRSRRRPTRATAWCAPRPLPQLRRPPRARVPRRSPADRPAVLHEQRVAAARAQGELTQHGCDAPAAAGGIGHIGRARAAARPAGAADNSPRDGPHGRDHDRPLPGLQARARGQPRREPGPGRRATRARVRGRRRPAHARRHDPARGARARASRTSPSRARPRRLARLGARASALGAAERGGRRRAHAAGDRAGAARSCAPTSTSWSAISPAGPSGPARVARPARAPRLAAPRRDPRRRAGRGRRARFSTSSTRRATRGDIAASVRIGIVTTGDEGSTDLEPAEVVGAGARPARSSGPCASSGAGPCRTSASVPRSGSPSSTTRSARSSSGSGRVRARSRDTAKLRALRSRTTARVRRSEPPQLSAAPCAGRCCLP